MISSSNIFANKYIDSYLTAVTAAPTPLTPPPIPPPHSLPQLPNCLAARPLLHTPAIPRRRRCSHSHAPKNLRRPQATKCCDNPKQPARPQPLEHAAGVEMQPARAKMVHISSMPWGCPLCQSLWGACCPRSRIGRVLLDEAVNRVFYGVIGF